MRQLLATLSVIVLASCGSTKLSQRKIPVSKSSLIDNSCSQTIKYYSNKLKTVDGNKELDISTEMIISPSTKLINLKSESPTEGNTNFDIVIESVDCALNTDLTSGQAIYKGYIKQIDGTTTKAIIKVEVKDGGLIISNADSDKPRELIMLINKWEVIQE